MSEKFLDSNGLQYYTNQLLKKIKGDIFVDDSGNVADLSEYLKIEDAEATYQKIAAALTQEDVEKLIPALEAGENVDIVYDEETNTYTISSTGGGTSVVIDAYTKEESDAKYALKEDIPSDYVTEAELDSKKYATETFVATKIAEAELSGGDVDLSAYATIEHCDETYSTLVEFNELKASVAELLYKAPSISSFSADSILNETGTYPSITLSWVVVKGTNDYKIYLGEEEVTGTSKTVYPSSNTTYTLKVVDTVNGKSVTKTTSVTFVYPSYTGVSANDIKSIADAKTAFGSSKSLKTSRSSLSGNYNCSNQYIYMLIPISLGEPTFAMNGFTGGFIEVESDATHRLYRSVEKQLNAIEITVK